MKNKYIFFRQYYKAICIAKYDSDEIAEQEAQKLAKELGESVIVCRHLTMYGADLLKRDPISRDWDTPEEDNAWRNL